LEVDLDKLLPITQSTQFEKIIVPDSCFRSGGYYTNDYCRTIERLRNFAIKHKTPTNANKIYFLHGQRQTGEERLAEYFKSKGYEIIRPEKLTLDEQLNLLINCESLASPLGSTSHNSVFMRDNMEVIVLSREGGYGNFYQRALSQINSANTIVIDSSLSIFYTRNGPFCYIISEPLRKFFGEKWDGYSEDDFKIFLQYVKDSINKGLVPHLRIKNYCAPTLNALLAQFRKHENLMLAYNMPHRWEYFRPLLNYQTHVDTKAWSAWNSEEQISNPLNQKFDIQAVKINFPSHKVYYSVYYNDKEGWSEEVISPEMAGTTGKSKSIYGIRIRLDESGAKVFDILYRVHKFDDTWTAWAKNGEAIYSHGVKLNAIQIKLEPKT